MGLGARQCFQAHGANDIGRFEAIVHSLNRLYGKGKNELRAVDQCQSFFGPSCNGCKS